MGRTGLEIPHRFQPRGVRGGVSGWGEWGWVRVIVVIGIHKVGYARWDTQGGILKEEYTR